VSPIRAALTLAVFSLVACASRQQTLLNAVEEQFDGQFHKCIPLGWNPAPIDGSYVPNFSVELRERDAWLPPLWLGFLPKRAANTPNGRTAAEVLDALARSGLVEKRRVNNGIRYNLTQRAFPYYSEGDDFGDNPDHLSYLCYSRLIVDRVVLRQTLHQFASSGNAGDAVRVAFSWHASEGDAWAKAPMIQSHSVVLAPTRSPAIVVLAYRHGELTVDRAKYEPTDMLAQPAVWESSIWRSVRRAPRRPYGRKLGISSAVMTFTKWPIRNGI
jgi:hypothetical protein